MERGHRTLLNRAQVILICCRRASGAVNQRTLRSGNGRCYRSRQGHCMRNPPNASPNNLADTGGVGHGDKVQATCAHAVLGPISQCDRPRGSALLFAQTGFGQSRPNNREMNDETS
jgi:hypothetical protein